MSEQLNEVEVEDVVDSVEEVVEDTTPDVVDEIDEDAEISGEDALAILAGEEEEPEPEATPDEPEATPEEDEATPEEDETPKDEDADDAEILESITNERTRERFQSLSHKNKELIESSEQQTQVIDAFKNQVTSTGLSNEDFTQVIGLMGKANSTDMNSVKEARAFIRDLDKTLTDRIGDTPDAYTRFDDLKKDYEEGELSEDWANKEAQRRIQDQAGKQHSQQQNHAQEQKNQAQQQQEQFVMEQANAIESMVHQFKSTDPDFALKESQLQDMTSKIVADGVPMSQWATEFVNRYHSINVSQRKPSPTPMSSNRQAKNVNNYASSDVSDEQANYDFAMSLTGR
jgi:hypothetical protein